MVSVSDLGVDLTNLAALCERWSISKIALFGSFARGEARDDSDIDLMITFLPECMPSLWNFVALKDEFEGLFGREVDLLVEGPIRNPFRRRSIERDLTTIYAA